VEGAKRICFVLQSAAEGHTTPEFQTFLSQSSTELLKALTHNIDQVGCRIKTTPCMIVDQHQDPKYGGATNLVLWFID